MEIDDYDDWSEYDDDKWIFCEGEEGGDCYYNPGTGEERYIPELDEDA